MKLNQLATKHGATTSRRRVGRGPGSGIGKTGGHGQKGQKSRTGVAIGSFEGGQMPIHMRLPKRGFHNVSSKHFQVVNVGRLQEAVDAGKLDPKKTVDAVALQAAGVIRRPSDGVRVLAKGALKAQLSLDVAGASTAATAAIEAAGGTITVLPPKPRTEKKGRTKTSRARAKGEIKGEAKGEIKGEAKDAAKAPEKPSKAAKE